MTRPIDRVLAARIEAQFIDLMLQNQSTVPEYIAGISQALAVHLSQELLCGEIPNREALAKIMQGIVQILLEPEDPMSGRLDITDGLRQLT